MHPGRNSTVHGRPLNTLNTGQAAYRQRHNWRQWPLNIVSSLFKTLSLINLEIKALGKKYYPEAFIISIDNLSFGGTGKTTLVAEIGERLRRENIPFAIVTRGYKSLNEKKGIEVQSHHSAKEVGDEAKIFKTRFPHRGIYIGQDRRQSIQRAIAAKNRVILLDDGFQTTNVHKNFKIMLYNASQPFYYLRNFKFLAKREDVILCYQSVDASISRWEKSGGPTIGTYDFLPGNFYDPRGRIQDVRQPGVSLLGFSALGDNPRFKRDLAAFDLVGFKAFRDHHAYTAREINDLDQQRIKQNATFLACTEKDFIKIKDLKLDHIPLIYARNSIKWNIDLISQILKRYAEEK
jgi:tetraacyldisaccharide 4'-kinase